MPIGPNINFFISLKEADGYSKENQLSIRYCGNRKRHHPGIGRKTGRCAGGYMETARIR